MKKVILVSILALYVPMLSAAASKTPSIESLHIISDQKYPITSLEKKYNTTWTKAYTAVNKENYDDFASALIPELVNKVSYITPESSSTRSIAYVMTLLEYLAKQTGSANQAKMIDLLLRHGAHTRSTYGIGQDQFYQDHLPPIYYAIIGGNIRAFEALISKDKAVSMRPAMDIWDKDDKSENPSIKMLLDRLKYIKIYCLTHPMEKIELPESLPAPEILDSMLILIERPTPTGCIVE